MPERRQRPRSAAEWKELLDEPSSLLRLTPREREAMTICHVEWPEGASNLEYMTQREMALRMGVSVVTLGRHLDSASYKLGLTSFAPRNKIPAAARRELLAATNEDSICDLCQRSLGRVPVPPGELTWADLMGPPRFLERVSIDHILPVSQGGRDDVANLRVVHAWCNLSDGARTPAEQLLRPPFGYVRRTEALPNGRGPRKWIEVDPEAAAIVRFLLEQYATGQHSIASLVRALKAGAAEFDAPALARLLGRGAQAQADEVVSTIQRHARTPRERELRAGYVPLVPAATAAACYAHLVVRWERISRARETREARLQEQLLAAEQQALAMSKRPSATARLPRG